MQFSHIIFSTAFVVASVLAGPILDERAPPQYCGTQPYYPKNVS